MRTFDSARRDLLRLSSMGLAASAVSAIPALGAAKKAAAPPLSPMLFDVRTLKPQPRPTPSPRKPVLDYQLGEDMYQRTQTHY
jgi:hypothetical protein